MRTTVRDPLGSCLDMTLLGSSGCSAGATRSTMAPRRFSARLAYTSERAASPSTSRQKRASRSQVPRRSVSSSVAVAACSMAHAASPCCLSAMSRSTSSSHASLWPGSKRTAWRSSARAASRSPADSSVATNSSRNPRATSPRGSRAMRARSNRLNPTLSPSCLASSRSRSCARESSGCSASTSDQAQWASRASASAPPAFSARHRSPSRRKGVRRGTAASAARRRSTARGRAASATHRTSPIRAGREPGARSSAASKSAPARTRSPMDSSRSPRARKAAARARGLLARCTASSSTRRTAQSSLSPRWDRSRTCSASAVLSPVRETICPYTRAAPAGSCSSSSSTSASRVRASARTDGSFAPSARAR